ncbi:MAG TPA: NAD(P)/FAD-dependent oxidoreductase [Steroidobacteraceae bacterium]|nr:NAD(P)/FAD-dependent oxidoreductase [Steroidobacteraceae bacterium]
MQDLAVGVVGGGVLGMYLARELAALGARVTLIESAPALGGLAGPARVGDYQWDRFYHVILMSDAHTRSLIESLGLADRLRWGITRTGFYSDGQMYSMSNSVEFLRFPPLNLFQKLRLGGTIFWASRLKDWRALESELVVDWLRRFSGKRVVEKIWLPLLKSKLGDNYKLASASFIWAIIARMYAARRSGLKQEMFGYVEGGYDVVLEALARHLRTSGVSTRLGARVEKIESGAGRASVSLADGTRHEFDEVLVTLPTPQIADLVPQLSANERQRLRGVVYQGIVCASLLLRKPLGPFYVTNITDRWVPFTGVIEMTALVDRKHFGGNSLVYLPCYLTQEDAYWQRTDADVQEDFVSALEKMYPDFRRDDVLALVVSRARRVLAVSTLHYSEKWLPPVATSLPHVSIINSAQIANGTLNVNETIGAAKAGLATWLQARHVREPVATATPKDFAA